MRHADNGAAAIEVVDDVLHRNSSSGKSWKRRKMTRRSAVLSASSPEMWELPGLMKPVCEGSVVMKTLHVKP